MIPICRLKGMQIAYVPDHTKSDWINRIIHKDVDFGFIYAVCSDDSYFCKFWSKDNPKELRTKSCSEKVYTKDLFVHESVPQEQVVEEIERIDNENKDGDYKRNIT